MNVWTAGDGNELCDHPSISILCCTEHFGLEFLGQITPMTEGLHQLDLGPVDALEAIKRDDRSESIQVEPVLMSKGLAFTTKMDSGKVKAQTMSRRPGSIKRSEFAIGTIIIVVGVDVGQINGLRGKLVWGEVRGSIIGNLGNVIGRGILSRG